jgi:hypothetical protein
MRRYRALTIALLVAVLLLTLAGLAVAQSGKVIFTDPVEMRSLTVRNSMTIEGITAFQNATAFNGNVTLGGTATVDGDLSTGGDLQAAGFIRPAANAPFVITNGATITPTGTFHAIGAAGNVAFGSIAAGSPGDLLILFNEDNVTITISDTGTLKLSGNLALGQFDSVTLLSDGTNWIQLATSNN